MKLDEEQEKGLNPSVLLTPHSWLPSCWPPLRLSRASTVQSAWLLV